MATAAASRFRPVAVPAAPGAQAALAASADKPATPATPPTPENIGPYLADFERFAKERPAGEPSALRALRRAAIDRFAALGFPTLRQEEWRFTNVAPIARGSFARAARTNGGSIAERKQKILEIQKNPEIQKTREIQEILGTPGGALAELECDVAARLVFVGGQFAPRLSRLGELPAGVVVASLADALAGSRSAATAENIEAHLGRHAAFAEQPFVALNTAFFADGALVVLPRGMVLEKPIHLLFLGEPGAAPDAGPVPVAYPRTLIVLGEGSQATVVESYAGAGAYFTCPVTELVAGPGAVVDHYKVQRESREAFHMATFQLHGERRTTLSSHSISLGGSLVRNDVNAVLDGEGIDCILNGLYLAEGRQLVDNHMRVEHVKPHCSSHELYKGILDGKARSVFNGLIHVHHGAQKTDAKQSNRNLLLSPDAIANSNPQLEIFADDVKCTHGSTVGQLDDDAIFYLRSRGIGERAARSLLTYAFASAIVERIRVEAVCHDLEEFLFARLPRGEVVRQAI